MKQYVLAVTLNPTIDKVVYIDAVQKSRDIYVNSSLSYPGGKGINVARALQQWGFPVISTGFVGGVTGKMIGDHLEQAGAKHAFISIESESRMHVTVIPNREQDTMRLLEKGPQVLAADQKRFKEQYQSLAAEASWIVLSGRLPQGIHDVFYAQLIQMLGDHHALTVVDTTGEALIKACRARPFLIKPNQEEAEAVLGFSLRGRQDYQRALTHFKKLGARHVIISLGKKGLVGADQSSCYYVAAPNVEGAHYVGCGDALVAGFIEAYTKKRHFGQALIHGAAAGAANLSVFPSCNIKKTSITSLVKTMSVETF